MQLRHWSVVALLFFLGSYPDVWADCPVFTGNTLKTVAVVFDGDTVALTNGERVRLAGLDAPELGHGYQADSPNAKEAKQLLERIVQKSNMRVYVEPEQESKDRYGRLIAHIYTESGRNIQAQILQSGLALGYARSPNLGHLDCYRVAEDQARNQNIGMWHSPPQEAESLAADASGFTRVHGTVRQTTRAGKSVWIELGSRLSLRVAQEDLTYFNNFNFDSLTNAEVEVRGYLYTYRGRLQMRIRHPADLRRIN